MALLDLLKFVTNGAWGTGLARPLTAPEGDTNIYSLAAAIQNLIDNPVPGVGIENIVVSGRQLTIYMTDDTTYGPFDLPVAQPRYRGTWGGAVSYSAFDLVRVGGYGTYMVLQDHTSDTTFDPAVGNSAGFYYVQIGPDPFYTAICEDYTASTLTLDLTYQNKYIRSLNATALGVTLNAGVFPPNAEIHFRQAAAGPISITAGSGVFINVPPGFNAESGGVGAVMSLKHVTADEWDLYGKLAEASA